MNIYSLVKEQQNVNINESERLIKTRERRNNIKIFRNKYLKLYNLNKPSTTWDTWSWHELNITIKNNYNLMGFTEYIWNWGSWPIKASINNIYENLNIKFKIFCILEKEYKKNIKKDLINGKILCDSNRASCNKDLKIIIDLPTDVFYKVLEYL